jgi:Putative Actinobacterial Holin-X, holin superfamily III
MLQALLASGALFSGIKAEATARVERIAFMLVMAVLALVFLVVGLGALAFAASIALEPRLGLPGAIAAVGGVAILIAAILVFVGTHKKSATAATSKKPAAASNSALPGIADAAGQAPVPWLIGALALGLMLGRKS